MFILYGNSYIRKSSASSYWGFHTMASLNKIQQTTFMYVVVGEMNDGNSSKLFFILMQLYTKIPHETGGCLGNLLENNNSKWILGITFSRNRGAYKSDFFLRWQTAMVNPLWDNDLSESSSDLFPLTDTSLSFQIRAWHYHLLSY